MDGLSVPTCKKGVRQSSTHKTTMENETYGRNTGRYLELNEELLNWKKDEDSYQRHTIKLKYSN